MFQSSFNVKGQLTVIFRFGVKELVVYSGVCHSGEIWSRTSISIADYSVGAAWCRLTCNSRRLTLWFFIIICYTNLLHKSLRPEILQGGLLFQDAEYMPFFKGSGFGVEERLKWRSMYFKIQFSIKRFMFK